MLEHNLIWTLDSYKDLHDQMLPPNTTEVYSYLESRIGSMYYYTIFFGLQYILKKWLVGQVITKEKIDQIEPIMHEHFKFSGQVWNRSKWDYIVNVHNGYLPIKIDAVAEGSKVLTSNVLMTIENTDPNCAWLTNALETVLQQVWYPTTVCTRSHYIVNMIRQYMKETAEKNIQWLADFMLHDFGQRGVSCMEAAGIGGMAHLVNSKGTDSKMAIPFAMNYYEANYKDLCYSVPASEHSVMCAEGKAGEFDVVKRLIKQFPNGILSVVSDTYDIDRAVIKYCTDLKEDILARNGKFVIRPDSPRFSEDTPEDQVVDIADMLWDYFGGTINDKGYKVLNPKVGIIYGDSLTENDIRSCLHYLKDSGFSAENCIYGCGGYLLQKVNRDTQKFAIKASSITVNGVERDIYKEPKDVNKISKKGKFDNFNLQTVFLNGGLIKNFNFDEIRETIKCQK